MSAHRFAARVLQARWLTLGLVFLLSVVAGCFVGRVEFDGSLEAWFLEDDPAVVTYNQFREKFSQDEFVAVGLFAEDVFAPDFVRTLHEFTQALESLPGDRQVVSLTNATILDYDDGAVQRGPLLERIPETAEEARQVREFALSQPMLTHGLVSKDGRATAVIVRLMEHERDADSQQAAIELIRRELKVFPETVRVFLAGTPVINVGMFSRARRDLIRLMPAAAVLIVIATWLLFRRWSAPLVPLTIVGLASFWVLGVMGLTGMKLTMLAAPLMLVILVVGVSNSIHVLAAVQDQASPGTPRETAIQRGVEAVLAPCLFTSLTTIVGFMALWVSDLKPLRDFGLMAATGVFFAFSLSMSLTPLLLRHWGTGAASRSAPAGRGAHGLIFRLLNALGRPSRRSSALVLAATLLLLVPSVWGLAQIEASANPVYFFRQGDPIREGIIAVDEKLGGSSTLELLVLAPDGGLELLPVLERMDEFERWMETNPAVTQVFSLVDLVKEYERVRTGSEQARLPDRLVMLVVRRLSRKAPEEYRFLAQDDNSVGRMTARVQLTKADSLAAAIRDFDARVQQSYDGPDLKIVMTGYVRLMGNMQDYVIASQLKSLALAAILISLIMFLLLRSCWLGLLAMIPNLIPIAIGMSAMGWLSIYLDPGTVMIASVAMGLVVDDTCHFLVHLQRCARQGNDLESAIRATMQTAGRPIILTSLILMIGFSALMFGSFSPTVYFGAITALIVFLALAADLLVLPALLYLLRPRLT